MAVSPKGRQRQPVQKAPGLTEVIVGLGWDPRVTDGTEFDLDASVFVTGENGKVLNDASFIFYNNKTSADGSIEHLGDNRSGQGRWRRRASQRQAERPGRRREEASLRRHHP